MEYSLDKNLHKLITSQDKGSRLTNNLRNTYNLSCKGQPFGNIFFNKNLKYWSSQCLHSNNQSM